MEKIQGEVAQIIHPDRHDHFTVPEQLCEAAEGHYIVRIALPYQDKGWIDAVLDLFRDSGRVRTLLFVEEPKFEVGDRVEVTGETAYSKLEGSFHVLSYRRFQ